MGANGQIPDDLRAALAAAGRVAVLTGAGVSAESGVPTFRDAQTGLWARYDPADLATPEAFARNPATVWRWYAWRRSLIAEAQPNPGHRALVELATLVPVTVVTQNVDGLHQRAGSDDVVELHGSIARTVCSRDRRIAAEPGPGEPPACPDCGAPLRPDVVWFGEALPADALDRAVALMGAVDLVLSVGTSTLVQPAAALPFEALRRGAAVCEINPEPTPLSGEASWRLPGTAATVLPSIVTAVRGGPPPD